MQTLQCEFFPSNTKLHNHVQDHHQKKPAKPASEIAEPSPSEAAVTPSTPKAEPVKITTAEPTPPATPPPTIKIDLLYLTSYSTKHTECNTTKADILGRNSLTPNHCTKTFASPSPYTKDYTKSVGDCSSYLPAYSTAYPLRQYRNTNTNHFTIDDLYRMFAEKPKPIGLSQHQIRRSFRRALALVNRFNEAPYKPASRPTSGLQPMRASRLVRARKHQIRGVFTNS
ncbi:hypothetical protein G7Y79_00071g097120 [Physcia stellaris]|nr:hypothetical protein G7Y79_00071g097120 [Physcia stellaris]